MTPTQMIADLDAALSRAGTAVTLRRYLAPSGDPRPSIDADCVGSLRAVSADELTGDIQQTDQVLAISPTPANAASWPLPVKKNDKILLADKELNVQLPKHIYVLGTLVRIDLVVRG